MNKFGQINRREFVKITGMTAGLLACGLYRPSLAGAAAEDFVGQRQRSVYATDANVYELRKSQDNPMIHALYDKNSGYLKEGPGGHKSHELLHTHYHDRSTGVKDLRAKGVKLAM